MSEDKDISIQDFINFSVSVLHDLNIAIDDIKKSNREFLTEIRKLNRELNRKLDRLITLTDDSINITNIKAIDKIIEEELKI